jgi:membrane associated rhomboid family serine protease
MFGYRERTRQPTATYFLILSMALIMAVLSVVSDPLATLIFRSYSLVPNMVLRGGNLYTLVTYMFLHSNWMHFALNAVALLAAGVAVERDIGTERFVALFFLSGIVAGLAHSLAYPGSIIPVVGASGAIFGVIAVLFLLMPFKITFALLVPLPAVLLGILLILTETYSAVVGLDPIVAHFAHLGGFAFGVLYAFLIDARRAAKGLVIAVLVYLTLYLLSRWLLLL